MSVNHPPLMRRRRSVELRSAQLSRHKEYLRECVDDAWFTELDNLPVQPTMFTTASEVDGECLRISFEYLRLRYNKKAKGQWSSEEAIPHPQTGTGLALVGRAYGAIKANGLDRYILHKRQQANRIVTVVEESENTEDASDCERDSGVDASENNTENHPSKAAADTSDPPPQDPPADPAPQGGQTAQKDTQKSDEKDGTDSDSDENDNGADEEEEDDREEEEEAPPVPEYSCLYDVVRITKELQIILDSEISQWQQVADKTRPTFFGDIVVYADQGRRSSMEDKHVVISDLNALFGLQQDYPYQAFFAIYDGHGGVEAAEYAKNNLHVNIVQNEHFATDVERAIRMGFDKTDNDFLVHAQRENITSGCTCIVSLVRGDTLYTAWLGDSQAMLCRKNAPVPDICHPHKPDREDEKQRIEELGGVVVWYGAWRVNGVLSVARAIGDNQLKKFVTSDCDVSATKLVGGEEFLCLACDGLWDVLDARAVVDFVADHLNEGKDTSEVAKALVKHAIRLGSADNISLIVVFFKDKQREIRQAQKLLAAKQMEERAAREREEKEKEVAMVGEKESAGTQTEVIGDAR